MSKQAATNSINDAMQSTNNSDNAAIGGLYQNVLKNDRKSRVFEIAIWVIIGIIPLAKPIIIAIYYLLTYSPNTALFPLIENHLEILIGLFIIFFHFCFKEYFKLFL